MKQQFYFNFDVCNCWKSNKYCTVFQNPRSSFNRRFSILKLLNRCMVLSYKEQLKSSGTEYLLLWYLLQSTVSGPMCSGLPLNCLKILSRLERTPPLILPVSCTQRKNMLTIASNEIGNVSLIVNLFLSINSCLYFYPRIFFWKQRAAKIEKT